jgi:hypothetical protein
VRQIVGFVFDVANAVDDLGQVALPLRILLIERAVAEVEIPVTCPQS